MFRQQVADAMKASRGAAAAGDGGAAGAAAAADGSAAAGQQQQQEQQVFDYMLGEEEAACVEASTARFTANLLSETAPACYLPLLLQLVGAAAAPCHVRVSSAAAAVLHVFLACSLCAGCASASIKPRWFICLTHRLRLLGGHGNQH